MASRFQHAHDRTFFGLKPLQVCKILTLSYRMASFSRQAFQSLRRPISLVTRRSAHSTSSSARNGSILPWVLGSVTVACAATGAAAFYGSKKDSVLFGKCSILEVVKASPPDLDTRMERSFIMIKPDGVARGLVADIIKRFEQKGFKLVAMKFMQSDETHLKKHYADLSDKKFFPGLVKHMSSGPVVPMVWEGKGVVATGRQMLGETDPAKSKPGSIRGDYCIDVGRNIIHGSDSVESANHEIKLWFKDSELVNWESPLHKSVFE